MGLKMCSLSQLVSVASGVLVFCGACASDRRVRGVEADSAETGTIAVEGPTALAPTRIESQPVAPNAASSTAPQVLTAQRLDLVDQNGQVSASLEGLSLRPGAPGIAITMRGSAAACLSLVEFDDNVVSLGLSVPQKATAGILIQDDGRVMFELWNGASKSSIRMEIDDQGPRVTLSKTGESGTSEKVIRIDGE